MTTTGSAGAGAPDLAALAERTGATTRRMTSEIRAAIAAEQEGRRTFERLVDESRARERQLAKVLAALEGQAPGRPGRKPGPRPPKVNNVGEKRAVRVLEVLSEAGEPLTVKQVMERPGVGSQATVRNALEVLRERGQARMAGIIKVGMSGQPTQTYAAMPTGGDDGA